MTTPPDDKFPEDVDRFHVSTDKLPQIGQGGHAKIYKGSFGPHKNVVVKVWGPVMPRIEDRVREVNLLRRSHHQNIVRFFGVVDMRVDAERETIVGLVTECMDDGDLSKTVHNKQFIYKPGLDISWILQAAYAIQYLHEMKKMAHRDIKPQNMLLTNNYRTLKLCDYGLSKDYSSEQYSQTTGAPGTYWYMPPEKLLKEKLSTNELPFATDIYSFSISIWEIITRRTPYNEEMSIYDLHTKVGKEGLRPNLKLILMDTVKELFKNGWSHEPIDRPTIDKFVGLFEGELMKYPKEIEPVSIYTEEESPRKSDPKKILAEIRELLASFLHRWNTTKIEINESLYVILTIHNKINFFNITGIVSEDTETLNEVQGMYIEICQKVTEQFKEFSKCTIEKVWTAVVLEDIDRILSPYIEKYGSLHESTQRFKEAAFSHNLPFDWTDLEKYSQETRDFAERRKVSWSKSQDFSKSCKDLTEECNTLSSYLEKEEYSKIVDKLVGLINNFQKLEKEQKENEDMFMIYSAGELHDQLTAPRNVISRIDQKFSELVNDYQQKVTESAKDLNEYLLFCGQVSNVTTSVDEESLELLLQDVDREQKNILDKWFAAESNCRKLKEFKLDVEADVRTVKVVPRVREELEELKDLHTVLYNCHQLTVSLNEINSSLSSFSLLNEDNKVDNVVEFQLQTENLNKKLKEIMKDRKKISPRLPFSRQLEEYLDQKVSCVKQSVVDLIDINKKISQFALLYKTAN